MAKQAFCWLYLRQGDTVVVARTLEGHGRAYVVLERVLGRPVERPRAAWLFHELPQRLLYRVRCNGLRAGGYRLVLPE